MKIIQLTLSKFIKTLSANIRKYRTLKSMKILNLSLKIIILFTTSNIKES